MKSLRLQVVLLVLLVLLFLSGTGLLSRSNRHHEREVLAQAIDRSITACYAYEGHYPESLAYLKSHYGLTYDEQRFLVDYTVSASNLRPTYLIIEKGERDAEAKS